MATKTGAGRGLEQLQTVRETKSDDEESEEEGVDPVFLLVHSVVINGLTEDQALVLHHTLLRRPDCKTNKCEPQSNEIAVCTSEMTLIIEDLLSTLELWILTVPNEQESQVDRKENLRKEFKFDHETWQNRFGWYEGEMIA